MGKSHKKYSKSSIEKIGLNQLEVHAAGLLMILIIKI
jgi:hypothetical protein